MKRRDLLKTAGITGLASGFSLPHASWSKSSLDWDWQPYEKSIVIDGLSAAFDHGVDSLDATALAIYRRSGITAINATIPYPGDNYQTKWAAARDEY